MRPKYLPRVKRRTPTYEEIADTKRRLLITLIETGSIAVLNDVLELSEPQIRRFSRAFGDLTDSIKHGQDTLVDMEAAVGEFICEITTRKTGRHELLAKLGQAKERADAKGRTIVNLSLEEIELAIKEMT